ncbi:hypothetical protein GOBAR_AA38196 [Gossypium barbadense]|uniref:Uncharacterized protein n=1 Tax=Gossypium barbadense TaxID=3634 RepID=A0A2P5VUN8_GOSBA|nr:hypothetical protein GOBAR_AA38196 [Gossypium barbadense]
MPRRRLRDLSFVQNTPNPEETISEQQTTIGSSNVPNTPDEPAELQKARLLAGYLGIIARNANMLPINYKSWHRMPDSNKNQALNNIKARFALEVSDNYVKKELGKRWRDHKSTLKKEYFKTKTTLEEKLRNVSLRMLRYQWEDVDRERVRKSSRQKKKFTHTAGSKSFACVAEAEELSSGQKVGRLQLFDITHRKKDGSLMTSEAAEIMEKLKDKKAEYEVIASSDSFVNVDDIDNRIITEVLGPENYGRHREKLKFKENMNSSYNLKQRQQRGKQRQQRGKQRQQKIRCTPATTSEYDEDVSAVAKSAIIDYYSQTRVSLPRKGFGAEVEPAENKDYSVTSTTV